MAQETKTVTSDAKIVHPLEFTFATPTTVTATSPSRSTATFDLKLKHVCNHSLSSGTYKLESCPRCLGTGYYYDVKFNDVGKFLEVSLEDKLTQALEKLARTDENRFHPEIAMGIQKWLGALGNRENLGIIKDDIVRALASLKEIQKDVRNLSPRARISTINSISADLSDPDTLQYNITLTTVSGEDKTISGTITLSDLNT